MYRSESILIALVAFIVLVPLTEQQKDESELANIKCGTSNELADRIEVCAKPLLELVQGTTDVWPRNNADLVNLCEDVSIFVMDR